MLRYGPADRSGLSRFLANKVSALDRLGRFDEAIKSFDLALEADTRSATAWYNKGIFMSYLGRLAKALDCIEKVLQIDAGISAIWIKIGEF